MKTILHEGDIPQSVKIGNSIAIDSETMGLNPHRDRLCLVQLSTGNKTCHIIQYNSLVTTRHRFYRSN